MRTQSNIAARKKANAANRLCNGGTTSDNSSSSASTRTTSFSKHIAVMNSAKRSAQPNSHLASRVKVSTHNVRYSVNYQDLLQRDPRYSYIMITTL
jgi:hypothetical protein